MRSTPLPRPGCSAALVLFCRQNHGTGGAAAGLCWKGSKIGPARQLSKIYQASIPIELILYRTFGLKVDYLSIFSQSGRWKFEVKRGKTSIYFSGSWQGKKEKGLNFMAPSGIAKPQVTWKLLAINQSGSPCPDEATHLMTAKSMKNHRIWFLPTIIWSELFAALNCEILSRKYTVSLKRLKKVRWIKN